MGFRQTRGRVGTIVELYSDLCILAAVRLSLKKLTSPCFVLSKQEDIVWIVSCFWCLGGGIFPSNLLESDSLKVDGTLLDDEALAHYGINGDHV